MRRKLERAERQRDIELFENLLGIADAAGDGVPQPLDAVGGHFYRVPLEGEQHLQRLADGSLVINDENAAQTGVAGGGGGCRRIQRKFCLRQVRNSSTLETQDGR